MWLSKALLHFFAQAKERPLQDGYLMLLRPFVSAMNDTEIVEVEVKGETEMTESETETHTDIETDTDKRDRHIETDRDSFLANTQRVKLLVYKLHESRNMSNTLTMYPWHLAKAKSQFNTGKHNTFYLPGVANFLRCLLHSLAAGAQSVQTPEPHCSDPGSHLAQLLQ